MTRDAGLRAEKGHFVVSSTGICGSCDAHSPSTSSSFSASRLFLPLTPLAYTALLNAFVAPINLAQLAARLVSTRFIFHKCWKMA